MIEFIHIVYPGEPQSQTRHRHTSRGGFVRTYDPKSKDKQKFIDFVKESYSFEKINGMVEVVIQADFSIPKSFSKKKTAVVDGQHRPKKPDVDNIAKFYLDSLNGIAYNDDSQIVDLQVIKRYSILPLTTITIQEVLL